MAIYSGARFRRVEWRMRPHEQHVPESKGRARTSPMLAHLQATPHLQRPRRCLIKLGLDVYDDPDAIALIGRQIDGVQGTSARALRDFFGKAMGLTRLLPMLLA